MTRWRHTECHLQTVLHIRAAPSCLSTVRTHSARLPLDCVDRVYCILNTTGTTTSSRAPRTVDQWASPLQVRLTTEDTTPRAVCDNHDVEWLR